MILHPNRINVTFPVWQQALCLLLIGLPIVLLTASLMPDRLLVDETFHEGQIKFFMTLEWRLVPELTMLPGYHLLMAMFAGPLQIDSILGLRILTGLLSLSGVLLAWFYLIGESDRHPVLRSFQVLACPLLWPFFVLIYTDVVTLSVVLILLLLVRSDRLSISALAGVAAIAMRQTNVAWVALMGLFAVHERGLFRDSLAILQAGRPVSLQGLWQTVWPHLRDTAWLAIPLVAFILFVLVNGGIAVGDQELHHLSSIYPTQIYFMLLTLWVVLLPLHVANIGRILSLIRDKWWLVPVLVVALFVYLQTFAITHFHNFGAPEYHLRNRVLMWLMESRELQLLAFPAIAWCALSIAVTKLRSSMHYWLYPVSIMLLVLMELIEQRYYMVPLILFLLFRTSKHRLVETAILVWFVLLATTTVAVVATGKYFL